MDEVLKLVNRLQSACTLLGDTAGQTDKDLPGLWEMLPSIVVIGGQVREDMCCHHMLLHVYTTMHVIFEPLCSHAAVFTAEFWQKLSVGGRCWG